MGRTRSGEKTLDAAWPPGGEAIQEGQPHGRALVGKAAKLEFNRFEFGCQDRWLAVQEGGMIALGEDAADAFDSFTRSTLAASEPAPFKARFSRRNSEKQFRDGTQT